MQFEDVFQFGKYEGLKLIDVYRGTLNINRQLLREYVNFLLNTEIRFHFEKIYGTVGFQIVDEFEVTEEEIKTLSFRETGINQDGVPYGELAVIVSNIESDIELCLSVGNQIAGYEIGGFCSLAGFNKSTNTGLVVGADPGYISWCIKNIKGFFISTQEIEKLEHLSVAVFKGVHVLKKDGGTYEYFPKIEIKKFRFSEAIKQLNQRKAEQFESNDSKDRINYREEGPRTYGYDSWDEMAFYEAYEGDTDAWAHDHQ